MSCSFVIFQFDQNGLAIDQSILGMVVVGVGNRNNRSVKYAIQHGFETQGNIRQ
jgi:L-amino acid N-acyltransferase YncA